MITNKIKLEFGDLVRFKEAPNENIKTNQVYVVAEATDKLVYLTNKGFFGKSWFDQNTSGLEINTDVLELNQIPEPFVHKKLDNLVANFVIPDDKLSVVEDVAHLKKGDMVTPSEIHYDRDNVTFFIDNQYLGHGWFAATDQLVNRLQETYGKLQAGKQLHPKEIEFLARKLDNKYGAIKVKTVLEYDSETEKFWKFKTQVIGRVPQSENNGAVAFKCVRAPSLIGEKDECRIHTRVPDTYADSDADSDADAYAGKVVETEMDTAFLNPSHQYTWDKSERFKSTMIGSLHGREAVSKSDDFQKVIGVQQYLINNFPDVLDLLRSNHFSEHYDYAI